jgi:predicted PurR-regulated permease PerM
MFSRLILFLFIILFIFIILLELSSSGSSVIEGLTTNDTNSGDDLGVTVGRYTSKIDQLGKTIDSMQATILGILPTVAKNAQDNAKNQQAIQAIIANKDKT